MSASTPAAVTDAVNVVERGLGILVVDAEPALDGDGNGDRRLHGGDAIADQCRLRHQAGAEPPFLHAIGRAADVEVDLIVTGLRAHARTARERDRIGPAELQRDRVLGRVVAQEPGAVAVEERASGDHLGVDQGTAREQAVEEPAMPIRPVHHRGDGEFSIF